MRVILAAAALAATALGTANAPGYAAGALPPKTAAAARLAPMTVRIVTASAAECRPNCPQWIAAQGMIDASTLGAFKTVFKTLGNRKLPILVDSGGGLVDDALLIGRMIRATGLDVVVAKTVYDGCPEAMPQCGPSRTGSHSGAAIGRPSTRLAKCASSCAFLLAAGTRRVVEPAAFVGVHRLKTVRTIGYVQQKFRLDHKALPSGETQTRRTLVSERLVKERSTITRTPDAAYDKVAGYFREMGIGDGVMAALRRTPNNSIHWFSRTELRATAMATDTDASAALSGKPRAGEAAVGPDQADTPLPASAL